jgi:hypothetical protein
VKYSYCVFVLDEPYAVYEAVNVPRTTAGVIELYGRGECDIVVFDHNAKRVSRWIYNDNGVWRKKKMDDNTRASEYVRLDPPHSDISRTDPVPTVKKELLFQWRNGRRAWVAFCDGYMYLIVPLTDDKAGKCRLKVCYNYHANFYDQQFDTFAAAEDRAQRMYYENLAKLFDK